MQAYALSGFLARLTGNRRRLSSVNFPILLIAIPGDGDKYGSKDRKLSPKITKKDLTTSKATLKYRKFPRIDPSANLRGDASGFMSAKPFSQPPDPNPRPCKHPRVQIVSREEDAEFLECLECREVFEASELKDMSIEERDAREAQES